MILYGLLNTKLSDMSDKVVVTIPEKVLCKAIQIKDCRAEAFCGWWSKVYRESSSRKRNIENEEQYHEYQIWHVGVQEELDELKQEKRNIKKQIQLADGIVKEDLYTAYYAVSEKEEIVADRDVEIPGMEEDMLVERTAGAVVESERNVVVMNQVAVQLGHGALWHAAEEDDQSAFFYHMNALGLGSVGGGG